jgi:cysteinyl-tRNA synthetase
MRRFKENLGEDEVKDTAKAEEYRRAFLEAVNDDLNMPKALTLVWKLVREEKELSGGEKYKLLLEFDKVFALDLEKEEIAEKLPEEAEILIRKRDEARKAKDWETADKIREQLKAMGIIVEDTPQGVKWKIEKR